MQVIYLLSNPFSVYPLFMEMRFFEVFMQSQPLFFKISHTSAILFLSGTSNRISMIFLAQIPETAVLPIWLTRFTRPAPSRTSKRPFSSLYQPAHFFMRHKKYGKQLPQFFQTPVFQSFPHIFLPPFSSSLL